MTDTPSEQEPQEPDTLLDAVNALRRSYETNTAEMRKVREEINSRFRVHRLWQVVLAVVVLLAIGAGITVRHLDRRTEQHRAEDQRQSLLQGCERGNDQRATLREVINLAVKSQPVPPGLSPDLLQLYEQGQARTEALRVSLLALPGVQPVDCQLAYPPPTGA